MFRRRNSLLCATIIFALSPAAEAKAPVPSQPDFVPDPASVQRSGPGYRYPQAGWIVLHIEGEPYERGSQHGKLLAPEIQDYIQALATFRSPKGPAEAWRDLRLMVNALFLRRYDKEYLEEMKGIADGAAAAGAKFDNRPIDLVDIVTINSGIEVDFMESALDATPTGLEGMRFKEPPYGKPKPKRTPHCSAFAATGPATADGKIVFGHITMFHLYQVRHFNVWLDLKPAKGHRIAMQTFPGGIMSGMDYYMNGAGLLVAETTINQTKFDITGTSEVSRIRKVLQYADGIDAAVEILKTANNGLYTNEWLLADTKTNEIAMFELGTHKSKLWRSSKNEWFGGTEGFYWGCNNTKDLDVRLETIPSVDGKPANMVFVPSDRDQVWLRLFEKHKGKIGADFGFEAFTAPFICGSPSCDAKFTTSAMAREMKTWGLFGPPRGRTWEPTDEQRTKLPDIKALVSNDWTILHVTSPAPAKDDVPVAVDLVDLHKKAEKKDEPEEKDVALPPAWRGTILPKTDADIWLAAAFSDYEKIVALEKSLKAKAKDGKLSEDDQDKLDLALFALGSRSWSARKRLGADMALDETQADLTRDEWYHIAAYKGTMVLRFLRNQMSEEKFEKLMDDFGRANAGKVVTSEQFWKAAGATSGLDKFLFRDDFEYSRRVLWSIHSFEDEPERALIVYGTLKETSAQRGAAERLQRKIANRWCNCEVPIKADTEVTEAELKSHHLLLIGRPDTNRIAARCSKALRVSFGSNSFVLRGKTYANPATAIVAASENPFSPRYSVVVYAGLSAEATWRCIGQLPDRGGQAAELLLFPAGDKPKAMVVGEENLPSNPP